MTEPTFDATQAVQFDLGRGTVQAYGEARSVLIPASALDEVARIDAGAAAALGRSVGAAMGGRIATRLGGIDGVRAAALEAVLSQLAGELSVAGFGVCVLERWGRALVVTIEQPAVTSDDLVAALVEAAISGATGRSVASVVLHREASAVRVLVSSSAAAERVRGWLGAGVSWPDAIARLQRNPGGDA